VVDFVTERCLSSAHVYFKSEEMHGKLALILIPRKRAIQVKDMDTHIGDLHPSIVGEILIISHQQETQGQQTVK
jgi:hypothetical protein